MGQDHGDGADAGGDLGQEGDPLAVVAEPDPGLGPVKKRDWVGQLHLALDGGVILQSFQGDGTGADDLAGQWPILPIGSHLQRNPLSHFKGDRSHIVEEAQPILGSGTDRNGGRATLGELMKGGSLPVIKGDHAFVAAPAAFDQRLKPPR